ncbi:MAG: hypothetical protein IIB56_03200 [Planctomycetes bacterium]|nr:hypothetical protein [Planctomycetota bacterium]MCH8118115.1 hypothetical protein [Planctomycetota bacterium]
MNNPQELETLESFTKILEQLDIAYAIGGSMASSIYGKVRFTQDADITVEPFDNQADKLFEILKPQYYISKEAMYQALRQRCSFNIIHLESAFKIDIFIRKDTAFEKQLISRRRALKLSNSLEKSFSVISPEDIILLKLQWYRDSGHSERQWDDVAGILTIQAEKLDFEYLKKWAGILRIDEILEKAISESR